MSASLIRVVRFHARHHYRVAGWSEAQNRERFGHLTETHGHDYECAVTVQGRPDPLGMVMDLGQLDRILAEEVRTPFEGADLNQVIPAFAAGEEQPTCEALARFVFGRIAARLPGDVTLARVRIAEDPSLAGEYAGPG
jgi:6-pyruvoyl-tetrahydropterin synthase